MRDCARCVCTNLLLVAWLLFHIAVAGAVNASYDHTSCEVDDLESNIESFDSTFLLQVGKHQIAQATSYASSHRSMEENIRLSAKFQTDEHQLIGNMVNLTNGYIGARKMTLSSGFSVTYGDILGLCGDFYGSSAKPISSGTTQKEREERFEKMYACLDADSKDPKRVFRWATSDFKSAANTILQPGCQTYLVQGLNDPDHFAAMEGYTFEEQGGLGNWEAYSRGHAIACRMAEAGKAASDEGALQKALMRNACASHFLSDMFAAGHMRTPRRFVPLLGEQMMHWEDSEVGLNVRNQRGDSWRAYGDSCLVDEKHDEGRKIQLEALTASAEAVLQAYLSEDASYCTYDAATRRLVPNLALVQDYKKAKAEGNSAPMFVVKNMEGKLQGPGKLGEWADMRPSCNLQAYDRHGGWWSTVTSSIYQAMVCADATTRAFGTAFFDKLCKPKLELPAMD